MDALKLHIPTKLSDITSEQLLYISRLFLAGYTEMEFKVKAFLYLTGLKIVSGHPDEGRDPIAQQIPKQVRDDVRFTHSSIKKPFILDTEQIAELYQCCDFLLKPGEIQPIPRIGCAKARHFRLYDASFEEYLMAENYYFAYIETKLPEHLDNLISCLYRRPWLRWDASKIQKRAKQFRKVDPAVKNAVFMWYVGFRSYVPKRCKTLFAPASTGSATKTFNPRNYINGMVHQLTNGDITLKDKLMRQPAWDALDELEQRAIESDNANSK